jgi:hypothetical protein
MREDTPRLLVAESMEFAFQCRELDKEGNVIRTVIVELTVPDSITHDEITESYQSFLTSCGFVFGRGSIQYVREGE